MTGEILSILVKTELLVKGQHGLRSGIEILPAFGIVGVEILHVNQEITETSLLEHAHEVRGQGLLLINRNLKRKYTLTSENHSVQHSE